MRHVELTEDVRAKRSLELLRRNVFKPLLDGLLGSVVDDDVQSSERSEHVTDRTGRKRGIADIAVDRYAAAPFGFNRTPRLVCVVVLILVEDRNIGAFLGERNRDGPTDSAIAAGNDRRFSGE